MQYLLHYRGLKECEIMTHSLIVRGAPQEYVCQDGAWATLPEHLIKRNLHKLLFIHGTRSLKAATKYLPDLTSFDLVNVHYGGECCDEKVAELRTRFVQENCEAILAVGGGKIADLAKQIGHQLQVPVLILPTLAATCAAYTPLSVMYNQDGSMDRYDIFPEAIALTLIEPSVLLESPIDYMIAGIGDTLAKWYEGDAIIHQLATVPVEVQVAHFAAKKCQENLLAYGTKAIDAMKKGELTTEFITVVETNILLAGMVGGFGDEYGRTAAAHSIHDALTILPQSHHQLHGNKVAYGILVQLMLEHNPTEIKALLPFYQKMNLPMSLHDMDMVLTQKEYQAVAKRATIAEESIHLLAEEMTAEKVITAMQELETMMQA